MWESKTSCITAVANPGRLKHNITPHHGLCVLLLQLEAAKMKLCRLCLDEANTPLFDFCGNQRNLREFWKNNGKLWYLNPAFLWEIQPWPWSPPRAGSRAAMCPFSPFPTASAEWRRPPPSWQKQGHLRRPIMRETTGSCSKTATSLVVGKHSTMKMKKTNYTLWVWLQALKDLLIKIKSFVKVVNF